jgi:hypothetical protein
MEGAQCFRTGHIAARWLSDQPIGCNHPTCPHVVLHQWGNLLCLHGAGLKSTSHASTFLLTGS